MRNALPSALPSTQPDLRLANFIAGRAAFHADQANNTHISATRRADHAAKAALFAARATAIRERRTARPITKPAAPASIR